MSSIEAIPTSVALNWRRKLRQAIEDRKTSRSKLCKAIGVAPSRLTLWINKGVGEPSFYQMAQMCKELDIPLSWMLEGDMDFPPPEFRSAEEQKLVALAREIGIDELYRRLICLAVRPANPAETSAV